MVPVNRIFKLLFYTFLMQGALSVNGQNMIKNGGFESFPTSVPPNSNPCTSFGWKCDNRSINPCGLTNRILNLVYDVGAYTYFDSTYLSGNERNKIFADTTCTFIPNPKAFKGFCGQRFAGVQTRQKTWPDVNYNYIFQSGFTFYLNKSIDSSKKYLVRFSLLTVDSNTIPVYKSPSGTPVYNSTSVDSFSISIAHTDSSLGTVLFALKPVFDKWTHYTRIFIAPDSASFLGAGNLGITNGTNYMDNFQLFEYKGSQTNYHSICKGDSINLTTTDTGTFYIWNDKDSTRNIWVSDSGWYIGYTQSNYGVFIDSIHVGFGALLKGGLATKDTTICRYDPVQFISNYSTNVTWNWSSGDTTEKIVPADSGTYWCKAIYPNTCFAIDTFTLHYASILRSHFNHDTTICENLTAQLKSSFAGWSSYIWNTNEMTNAITPTSTGGYWCKAIDNSNCYSIDSFNYTKEIISPLPLKGDSSFCSGLIITLDAFNAQYNKYLWSTGDTSRSIIISKGGLHTVTATNGICTTDATVNMHELPLPQLHLTRDTSVCFDELKAILLDAGQWKSYTWYPTGEHSRTIHATYPEIYRVVVADSNDCIGTDTALIEEECPDGIYMPNAFTPNTDGINDTLMVQGTGIKEIELHIFDRWGLEVFRSTELIKGWDGNFKGQIAPEGVYSYNLIYKLRKNNSTHSKSGTVTLLR